jgi:beta-glucanase (GH16 family)
MGNHERMRARSSGKSVRAAVALVGVACAALSATLTLGGDRGATAATRKHARWKLVFADDFSGGLDRSRWIMYSGQPGGDPGGWWDPSHVNVVNGILDLQTYRDARFGGRWVSGGVSSSPALRQRYGKYLVRFRMDAGRGVLGVLLLWPAGNVWPPEIDFAENAGKDDKRDKISATLHAGSDNRQLSHILHGDFTSWHTAGVEWSPRRLVYTMDGQPWASLRGPLVPDISMELDMQAQAGTCGRSYAPCPGLTTPGRVNLQIDSVRAYRYVPPRR